MANEYNLTVRHHAAGGGVVHIYETIARSPHGGIEEILTVVAFTDPACDPVLASSNDAQDWARTVPELAVLFEDVKHGSDEAIQAVMKYAEGYFAEYFREMV